MEQSLNRRVVVIFSLLAAVAASVLFLFMRGSGSDSVVGNTTKRRIDLFASVTKDDMQGIELVCPPDSLVRVATQHFEPLHTEIATLSQQIQNLRVTRDALLPRLLSGQIDVEIAA